MFIYNKNEYKEELSKMNISDLRFVCKELNIFYNGNKKVIKDY